jgi:predicted amidohydrolase YtcJ
MLFADLVLTNGRVVLLNGRISFAEGLAVKGDRIVEVGRNADMEQFIGHRTTVLELDGNVVLPGFIDVHAHPASYGACLAFEVDCAQATSIKEIIDAVEKRVSQSEKGNWIRAYGYDDHSLAEERHPTRWDLDKAAPENPVVLKRVCGHMIVCNSLALEALRVTKETVAPLGGIIDKDPASGEPTGLLREKAAEHAMSAIPPLSTREIKKGLEKAFYNLLSWGITTVYDAEAEPSYMRAYQELKAEGRLPVRVSLLIPNELPDQDLLSSLASLGIRGGFGDEWLKVTGIKFFGDGSLGGHTAALNEAYLDDPKNYGVLRVSPDVMTERASKAHISGFQICIHAIGDKAIDVALDAIEEALKRNPRADHRHRIEHCGLCTPKQLKRMKDLGVCASASTSFLQSGALGEMSLKALGEDRMQWYYPHKSFVDYGIVSAEGSDLGASTSADPLGGICTLVTRKSIDGKVYGQNQATTLEEAIRSYTTNAAYLGFDEKDKGCIEEGKLADLVVLSDDLFSIPPDKIRNIKVDITIVGGQIRYRRGS